MQYTVLATSVVNVHWRSQYGANGATAHPPGMPRTTFANRANPMRFFVGQDEGVSWLSHLLIDH